MQPPRIFRVCATRADCHVPPQELTIRESKSMVKQKAAGEATTEAWSSMWMGKVQAYKNVE